jgi:hypothetical protein
VAVILTVCWVPNTVNRVLNTTDPDFVSVPFYGVCQFLTCSQGWANVIVFVAVGQRRS